MVAAAGRRSGIIRSRATKPCFPGRGSFWDDGGALTVLPRMAPPLKGVVSAMTQFNGFASLQMEEISSISGQSGAHSTFFKGLIPTA